MVKITDYIKINLFAKTVATFDGVDSVHVNYGRNEVEITCKHGHGLSGSLPFSVISGSLPFSVIVDSFNKRFLAQNL